MVFISQAIHHSVLTRFNFLSTQDKFQTIVGSLSGNPLVMETWTYNSFNTPEQFTKEYMEKFLSEHTNKEWKFEIFLKFIGTQIFITFFFYRTPIKQINHG